MGERRLEKDVAILERCPFCGKLVGMTPKIVVKDDRRILVWFCPDCETGIDDISFSEYIENRERQAIANVM